MSTRIPAICLGKSSAPNIKRSIGKNTSGMKLSRILEAVISTFFSKIVYVIAPIPFRIPSNTKGTESVIVGKAPTATVTTVKLIRNEIEFRIHAALNRSIALLPTIVALSIVSSVAPNNRAAKLYICHIASLYPGLFNLSIIGFLPIAQCGTEHKRSQRTHIGALHQPKY